MEEGKRWYDEYPKLAEVFTKMQGMEAAEREKILLDLRAIVDKHDPDFIDRNVLEFPMTFKRRWYDADPYAWLVVNCLQYADDRLMAAVMDYIHKVFK
jgi:hypothetical protein